MVKKIRLSEATAQVTSALATLDGAALGEVRERLHLAGQGRIRVVPEGAAAVKRKLRILEGLLLATEQNINVLCGLRERKARNEWAL